MCVCVCETLGVTGILLNLSSVSRVFSFSDFTAGGTGGADETGANKNAHQLPVIQLEASNCVPTEF